MGKRKVREGPGVEGARGGDKILSRAPAVWGAWCEEALIPEAVAWAELIPRDLIQQGCEIINTFRRGCDKTRPISGLGCDVQQAQSREPEAGAAARKLLGAGGGGGQGSSQDMVGLGQKEKGGGSGKF